MCPKVLKITAAKIKPLNLETINSLWELILFSGVIIIRIPQLSLTLVGASNQKKPR